LTCLPCRRTFCEIDLNLALTLSIILISLSFLTPIIVKGFLHRRMEMEREYTPPKY